MARNVLPEGTENVLEAFYEIDAADQLHLHVVTDLPRVSSDDPRFSELRDSCNRFVEERRERLESAARGRRIRDALIASVIYEATPT